VERGKLQESCRNLHSVLTDDNRSHCDVNGNDLLDELVILSSMLPKDSCPQKALSYITKNSLTDVFPNVFVSLRILLTLPVSVARGERSFSKLKRMKNYLRSTISQERLTGIATLAIENDVLAKIDTDPVVKAMQKARKISFKF
jgi:hypothetical protein